MINMELTIKPNSGLRGKVQIPGDKSISHRILILSAIAEGKTRIRGFLRGEDCLKTKEALIGLGTEIEDRGDELIVNGCGLGGLSEPSDVLDMGNSGTGARLLSGLLSGQEFFTVLTGDDSLRTRPMLRIVEPLTQMGADIRGRNDGSNLPLAITGSHPLSAISHRSQVASAQVKSSILFAGLYAEGTTMVIEPAISRDHTERMLAAFGAEIQTENLTTSIGGYPRLEAVDYTVPGDISSAAYFLAAGCMVPDSRIEVKGIGLNPTRNGFLEVLEDMGAEITIETTHEICGEPVGDIAVESSELQGTVISGDLIPRLIDEIPILAVMGAYASGITRIKDAEELRVKETDRLAALARILAEMGVEVSELEDGLVITGRSGRPFSGGTFPSFRDHRIALSLAVAGLVAEDGIKIENAEYIRTSFPGFMEELNTLLQ